MINRVDYINRIKPFINKDIIKVLTGIRRCGKSSMLEQIKIELYKNGVSDKDIISFNFEQISNIKYNKADLLYEKISNLINDDNKKYIFLDEIQEVEAWEKCVNSLRVEYNCDLYLTGSNSHLLSSELATHLSGRYIEIPIYPFSFSEFILSKDIQENDKSKIKEYFSEYMKLGGMPFLTNLDNFDSSMQYLQDLFNSVVLKDIIERNNIRDLDMLNRLISYMCSNIGQMFSANNIANFFKSEKRKISSDTILNYMEYCLKALLFYKAKREDLKGKKLLSVNEKYFIADIGIREVVYGNNIRDINQILENIIFMELLKRNYKITIGKIGDKEIDFIARLNNKKLYIQVCYLLASKETINREFGVFNLITDNYPKYVLSMDELDFSQNGIKHMNIIDFLLNKDL